MHEKLEIKEAIGISPISSALSNSSKSIQSIFFNSKIYRVNRYYNNYTAYRQRHFGFTPIYNCQGSYISRGVEGSTPL
jgi:hypothetical protein